MKKRILILANSDKGFFNFRRELAERLIMDGHEVYVSLPKGEFKEEITKLGCIYIETNLSSRGTNLFQDLKLLIRYKSLLHEVKPDIVFTYTIKPNIYGGIACSLARVPYVMNITGLGTAVENPGLLQKITLTLYRIAISKVQTVFFQNNENENFFTSKKLALGKHKMLPGSGVNLEFYEPLEYPVKDTLDFVFVARIMKEKGIDQYLEAAKVLKNKYPQTRFHICGFCGQDYETKIRELHNNGTVVYHGSVKDMKEIYRQIHCTVLPTYYPEGMSNVLLEACASGRPIITTDRAGCREIIDDRVNGFVVKIKDSNDLIEKLERFINLPYEQKKTMGLAARAKVEKEFNRQIVVRKYLEELDGLSSARL